MSAALLAVLGLGNGGSGFLAIFAAAITTLATGLLTAYDRGLLSWLLSTAEVLEVHISTNEPTLLLLRILQPDDQYMVAIKVADRDDRRPSPGVLLPVEIKKADPGEVRILWSDTLAPAERVGDDWRTVRFKSRRNRSRLISVSALFDVLTGVRKAVWQWTRAVRVAGFTRRLRHWRRTVTLERYTAVAFDAAAASIDPATRQQARQSILDHPDEIYAETAQWRRAARIALAAVTAQAVPCSLFVYLVSFVFWVEFIHHRTLHEAAVAWNRAVRATGYARYDVYVVIVLVVVVGVSFAGLEARAAVRLRRAIVELRLHMERVVAEHIRVAYRRLVNAVDYRELWTSAVPGSATLETRQMVDRPEMEWLSSLALGLGTGAVAVGGPRGAGKSTLLRRMVEGVDQDPGADALVVLVSAPVRYDGREFLLNLYAQLCRAVIGRHGSLGRWRYRSSANLIRWAGLAATGLAMVLLVASVASPVLREGIGLACPLPHDDVALLLMALTAAILWTWLYTSWRRQDLSIVREAERRLRQTRYLQTLTVEGQGTVTAGPVAVGRTRSRASAEQPLTLPDVVRDFREFASVVANWWVSSSLDDRAYLLIGIDEVDRIIDGRQAEQFLNEIKAVFGVRHCVFLVSVSEEALRDFEGHTQGVRTAFDSAFDEALRLPPLHLDQSVELLRRRMPTVPDRFLVLCRLVSGGSPRDLLRNAQTMLDRRRHLHNDLTLPAVATAMVTGEIERLTRNAALDCPPELLERLIDPTWPGSEVAEIYRSVDEAGLAATQLGVRITVLATVLAFAQHQEDTITEWVAAPGSDAMNRFVAGLDLVHWLTNLNPTMAAHRLRDLRQEWRFADLTEVPAARSPTDTS